MSGIIANIRITYWLEPYYFYMSRGKEKTNIDFCSELVKQIKRDRNRVAEIKTNSKGEVAVFSN